MRQAPPPPVAAKNAVGSVSKLMKTEAALVVEPEVKPSMSRPNINAREAKRHVFIAM